MFSIAGRQRSTEHHLPRSILVDTLAFGVLLVLYLQGAEPLGIHIKHLGIFILPEPDINRVALDLRRRLAMRKMGLLLSRHELRRSGIVWILGRIGIFE